MGLKISTHQNRVARTHLNLLRADLILKSFMPILFMLKNLPRPYKFIIMVSQALNLVIEQALVSTNHLLELDLLDQILSNFPP